jgi:tetratricopeptide (TPR) repeat protein
MSKRAFKLHTNKAKPFKLTGKTKWRSILWTGLILAAVLAMVGFGLLQGKGKISVRDEIESGARALAAGNWRLADSLARDAIHKDTTSENAHMLLATSLSRQERYEEAIASYREAIRLGRENPTSHLGLGAALEGAARRSEAITEYRRAVFLDSSSAIGHYHLGMALARENYRADAIRELEKFLRLSPKAPEKARVDSVLARLKQP